MELETLEHSFLTEAAIAAEIARSIK